MYKYVYYIYKLSHITILCWVYLIVCHSDYTTRSWK